MFSKEARQRDQIRFDTVYNKFVVIQFVYYLTSTSLPIGFEFYSSG